MKRQWKKSLEIRTRTQKRAEHIQECKERQRRILQNRPFRNYQVRAAFKEDRGSSQIGDQGSMSVGSVISVGEAFSCLNGDSKKPVDKGS